MRSSRFGTPGILAILLLLGLQALAPAAPAGPPAGAKMRQKTASLDGLRINYQDSGGGKEAVVFVHGWTCDLTFWREQLPAFAGQTRVIALDLPGHGRSDKPQIDYSQDLFARAVDAVMRHARVDRAVLVGHSMGTPVARQFYRLYPRKTVALVFVDGALRPLATKEQTAQRFQALGGPGFEQIMGTMADFMLGQQLAPQLRTELKAVMLSTPKYVVVSAGEGMNADAVFKTDPIGVPVLAVMSRSSGWPPDNEQFYRSLAPNLDYRTWDGVGHFLMLEKPRDFNQALTGFLQQIRVVKKRAA